MEPETTEALDIIWDAIEKHDEELNNLLPHNGRWHTVYEEDDLSVIDGIPIIKKEKESMT